MRQQTTATAAACASEQSKFIGDGSDMMPAIGTPVAANTSLGAPLTFTLPMSLPRLGDMGRSTIYCATLTRRAICLGTIATTSVFILRRHNSDETWILMHTHTGISPLFCLSGDRTPLMRYVLFRSRVFLAH